MPHDSRLWSFAGATAPPQVWSIVVNGKYTKQQHEKLSPKHYSAILRHLHKDVATRQPLATTHCLTMLDQLNFDIWTVILPSLECQDIAALGAVNRLVFNTVFPRYLGNPGHRLSYTPHTLLFHPRALRVLSWEDRSWKHQWEKAHCTHTTDDAPRPLRLRVQQAITSARGWNSASCTQQWLAPCTNPAPPPYPAEQVTAASFGSQTGSTVTRKFTALCLRGNLLVTASMPTRRCSWLEVVVCCTLHMQCSRFPHAHLLLHTSTNPFSKAPPPKQRTGMVQAPLYPSTISPAACVSLMHRAPQVDMG